MEHGAQRAREYDLDCTSSKRRRVQISTTSVCKVFHCQDPEICIDCQKDVSSSAHNYRETDPIDNNHACLARFHEDNESTYHEKKDFFYLTKTKEQDGPGSVIIATVQLVNKLVKQGTMTIQETRHLLEKSCCCGMDADDFSRRCVNSSESDCDVIAAIVLCGMQADISALSHDVASRLASLHERIRRCGKAVLPTSKAVMGPAFLPALEYLRGLVLEVGNVKVDEDMVETEKRVSRKLPIQANIESS